MNASVEGAAALPEVVPDDVTDAPHSELLSRIDETISKYRHHWADN